MKVAEFDQQGVVGSQEGRRGQIAIVPYQCGPAARPQDAAHLVAAFAGDFLAVLQASARRDGDLGGTQVTGVRHGNIGYIMGFHNSGNIFGHLQFTCGSGP